MQERRDDDVMLILDTPVPEVARELHERLQDLHKRIEILRAQETALWAIFFQIVATAGETL